MPYSDFARASGVSSMALLRRDLRHDLRYGFTRLLASRFAAVTAVFSTMSFFGFGAVPPDRDLGLMIASARAELPDAWWTAAGPAAMLILLLLVARMTAAWPDEGRA
jgi:peptide/nickel transport system permease protein